jgi:cytochrome bd-type quinol oxidase subunit 1
LVYRLGAGLHGLGRRGYLVAAAAVLVLAFALAYSEAIAQWGSRDLVGTIDDFRDSTKQVLHAVPHPIMALLGYPALVWGVFMRARRRQGWWVCVFGVAVTSPTASRLVAQHINMTSVVLGAVYSVLAGVVLGYLVIRIEQAFTGTRGRRARRDEEAEAHRPEPARFEPLH